MFTQKPRAKIMFYLTINVMKKIMGLVFAQKQIEIILLPAVPCISYI